MHPEPRILQEARLLLERAGTVGLSAVAFDEIEAACARLHSLGSHPACDDELRARVTGALLVCRVLAASHPNRQPTTLAS